MDTKTDGPVTYLFAGTYTRTEPHVDGQAEGVYAFRFEPHTGALELVSVTPGLVNPSFLTVDQARRRLYVVSEIDDFQGRPTGAVGAYAVDAASGTLSLLNIVDSHGIAPCHVAATHDGQALLITDYGAGRVVLFALEPDGRIQAARRIIGHAGSSLNPARQEASHTHSVTLTPDERFAIIADLGTDELVVYQLERATMGLIRRQTIAAAPGSGPRHVAFHPHQPIVYSIQELGSTVAVFAFDGQSGQLTPRQTLSTLPTDFAGVSTCADIHVHPTGRFVYGSNRGHDSIAVFHVDQATGELTAAGHASTAGRTPRNFAIAPDGRFLFAANQDTSTVVRFAIDPDDGHLSQEALIPVPTPVCLCFAHF